MHVPSDATSAAAEFAELFPDRLSQALSTMTASERKQLLAGMRALVRSADSLRPASNQARKEK